MWCVVGAVLYAASNIARKTTNGLAAQDNDCLWYNKSLFYSHRNTGPHSLYCGQCKFGHLCCSIRCHHRTCVESYSAEHKFWPNHFERPRSLAWATYTQPPSRCVSHAGRLALRECEGIRKSIRKLYENKQILFRYSQFTYVPSIANYKMYLISSLNVIDSLC